MSRKQADVLEDYYAILGADESSSQEDIERLYKRLAARHHPDRGGSEDKMKALNEAYSVLRNAVLRSDYDSRRRVRAAASFTPVSAPPAEDIGLLGHCLSAFICILAGLFLLLLVRIQWIWFLWPLAILALFVIAFGIMMARSAMVAVNLSLPTTSRLRRHTKVQEAVFWGVVAGLGYGLYIVLGPVR